jgi:hypothetical protein
MRTGALKKEPNKVTGANACVRRCDTSEVTDLIPQLLHYRCSFRQAKGQGHGGPTRRRRRHKLIIAVRKPGFEVGLEAQGSGQPEYERRCGYLIFSLHLMGKLTNHFREEGAGGNFIFLFASSGLRAKNLRTYFNNCLSIQKAVSYAHY